MAQHPLAAFALDAMKIDQDELPTGSEGVVDGFQSSLRKLEVVVSIANKNQIDRVLRSLVEN